jgi:hypothetical protein
MGMLQAFKRSSDRQLTHLYSGELDLETAYLRGTVGVCSLPMSLTFSVRDVIKTLQSWMQHVLDQGSK